MSDTDKNHEVTALNAAISGSFWSLLFYGVWALAAAALLFVFLYIFNRFLDTGSIRYFLPAVLWGGVAYLVLPMIWNRVKQGET